MASKNNKKNKIANLDKNFENKKQTLLVFNKKNLFYFIENKFF
jgi:hypothetical protein